MPIRMLMQTIIDNNCDVACLACHVCLFVKYKQNDSHYYLSILHCASFLLNLLFVEIVMRNPVKADGVRLFRRTALSVVVQGVIAGLVAMPVHAADASVAGDDDGKAVQLKAVTVTASGEQDPATAYTGKSTRAAAGLPLTIKETPQSVNVFTQKRMEDQGLATINEVLGQSTGVSVREYDSARQSTVSAQHQIYAINMGRSCFS